MTGTPEGDINRTSARDRWQAENLGSEARALLDRDGVAFLHQSLSTPCLNALRGATGSEIEDLDRRRLLDFHGNSVHQVGYGHPHVIAAVEAALHTLPFCPRRYTHEGAVRLAERLVAAAPMPDGKVLFCPGGAEAVGIALKIARLATGRHKVLGMWDAFHGASLEAASVGGEALFRSGIGPLLPGTLHVPPPDPRRCPLRCGGACNLTCADYLDYVFEKEGDVGAVIAEPIRATTAMVPPPDYWRRVREACDRHGALLIFDEIPTGLGRLGTLFASEVTGVTPDIVVLGKGLGGGVVPMAAVVARAELDVAGDRAIGHYTHEKSPVGCAAANAVLDLLEGGLLQDASEMGGYLLRGLSAIAERIPAVAEARGVGMLFALEMHRAEDAEAAMYRCLSDGLSLKVASGTVLTLTPPLTLTRDEADRALDILGMSTSL